MLFGADTDDLRGDTLAMFEELLWLICLLGTENRKTPGVIEVFKPQKVHTQRSKQCANSVLLMQIQIFFA